MYSGSKSHSKKDKEPRLNLLSDLATPTKTIEINNLADEIAKRVVQSKIFVENVAQIFKNAPSNGLDQEIITKLIDPSLVFVIISFHEDMEPIFEGIEAAGKCHDLRVERVLDVNGDYRITDKIIEMINKAQIIVVDLTGERPNVYFELGYARGLGKTIITTAREGTKLHFDVKDWKCHFYNDSRVLERYLKQRFNFELKRISRKGENET